jgi:Fe-S-cluster containining protein
MVDIYKNPPEAQRLSSDSPFYFRCHAQLSCFKQCCQNPTIILKPYDIIRLRKRLGITSTDFLAEYTITVLEDKSQLPLIMLDIAREMGSGCPFLKANGCGVYEERPGACRLFPVIQGSRLGKEGLIHSYFIKELDFCRGFTEGQIWTLSQWQADQGLEAVEQLHRPWLEIILTRGTHNFPSDDARVQAIFTMAAYDIDRFRHHVFKTPFLEIHEIPQEVSAVLHASDLELLRFGYKYLKMVLLIESPEKMREEMRVLP